MELTPAQESLLTAAKAGVANAEAFMAELTDYHGGEVTTEYLITVEIAKALLRGYPDVEIEYLINRIEGQALFSSRGAFTLGSQRFDVAVSQIGFVPTFVVEVKIRVTTFSSVVEGDLRKMMAFIDYLAPAYAARFLGVFVFQTHCSAIKNDQLSTVTKRIAKIEQNVAAGLETFAQANPGFEFEWLRLQDAGKPIHDDEVTTDVDGMTPMLGRPAHATRYHAILLRRRRDPVE